MDKIWHWQFWHHDPGHILAGGRYINYDSFLRITDKLSLYFASQSLNNTFRCYYRCKYSDFEKHSTYNPKNSDSQKKTPLTALFRCILLEIGRFLIKENADKWMKEWRQTEKLERIFMNETFRHNPISFSCCSVFK